jgi:hypothetical protein
MPVKTINYIQDGLTFLDNEKAKVNQKYSVQLKAHLKKDEGC